VDRVIKFNRIGSPGWWLNGRILKKETFGLWQMKLLNLLVPFVRPIDRFLPFPHLSWIVIVQADPQLESQQTAEALFGHGVLSTQSGYPHGE
jgi:hypothetical protein